MTRQEKFNADCLKIKEHENCARGMKRAFMSRVILELVALGYDGEGLQTLTEEIEAERKKGQKI